MTFRPVITTNSLGANFNNLNDFMRSTDGQLNAYRSKFSNSSLLSASVTSAASSTSNVTTIPHTKNFIPLLTYEIENTSQAPGEWHSGAYESVDTTSGITNCRVYMTADTVNVYLRVVAPSAGTFFAPAITFTAKYWVTQIA